MNASYGGNELPGNWRVVTKARTGGGAGQSGTIRTPDENFSIETRNERRAGRYFASSYRYSTNDIAAPSMPCTFGLDDSIT